MTRAPAIVSHGSAMTRPVIVPLPRRARELASAWLDMRGRDLGPAWTGQRGPLTIAERPSPSGQDAATQAAGWVREV